LNEEKCETPMVEGSYAPNKRERAANVHNFSKKANDAVLGQDVLKEMLPNSIQQLSIAEI